MLGNYYPYFYHPFKKNMGTDAGQNVFLETIPKGWNQNMNYGTAFALIKRQKKAILWRR
jgi:hypothetical protein